MNDPFEERLRALRPAPLPTGMRERLAHPPRPASSRRRLLAFVLPLAAAACVAVAVGLLHEGDGAAPAVSGAWSREVTSVRPLSVITDAENRAWELVEVSWVEESTLVSGRSPLALRVLDVHTAVVPTPVPFD